MADVFTTGVDRGDGYVVNATLWNQMNGATGNIMYLKNGGGGTRNYKTSTQVFTTNTTLADVTGAVAATFAFAIAASEVWRAEYWIPLAAGGTGGAKFALTGPAAPTGVNITGVIGDIGDGTTSYARILLPVTAFSSNIVALNSANGVTDEVFQGNPSLEGMLVHLSALIINGANAGSVVLQAAQNSSNSTTTLGLGTFMRAERLA